MIFSRVWCLTSKNWLEFWWLSESRYVKVRVSGRISVRFTAALAEVCAAWMLVFWVFLMFSFSLWFCSVTILCFPGSDFVASSSASDWLERLARKWLMCWWDPIDSLNQSIHFAMRTTEHQQTTHTRYFKLKMGHWPYDRCLSGLQYSTESFHSLELGLQVPTTYGWIVWLNTK